MGRDQVAAGAAVERDLEQVARVEAQDGPAIRREVPDLRQRSGDAVGGLERRGLYQMVHFPCALGTAIDSGDLNGEHESHRLLARRGHPPPHGSFQIGPQPQQARFGGNKAVFEFVCPCGMSEVTGADHADALAQCSGGQVRDVPVPAACARKLEWMWRSAWNIAVSLPLSPYRRGRRRPAPILPRPVRCHGGTLSPATAGVSAPRAAGPGGLRRRPAGARLPRCGGRPVRAL